MPLNFHVGCCGLSYLNKKEFPGIVEKFDEWLLAASVSEYAFPSFATTGILPR